MGPLKTAVGGYNHIFVAIDKFTKWIEVKPVTATTTAKAAEFIEEISHRFGVPNWRPAYLIHGFRILGLLPRKLHRRLLRLRGASQVQWPSRKGQWLDPPGAQGQNFRSDRKIRCKVAPRTTQSSLGTPHAEKPGYRQLAILYGVQF